MDAKKEFIAKKAAMLVQSGKQETGGQLVISLNANGHKSYYNTPFVSGRGVYKLLHATYDSLVDEMRQSEADMVALAFTNAYGQPAWEK